MECPALEIRLLMLALVAAAVGCAAPSTDGARTYTDPELGILISTSGSSERPLAAIAAQYPIVFMSIRDGADEFALYIMTPEGGGRDAVRLLGGADHYFPRWAPGAESIAFRRQVDGAAADIGIITSDGQQAVFLTDGEHPSVSAYPPNWSPDGERISFASLRDDEMRVWTVPRLGGSAERLLPQLNVEHREATWSPDGSRIAYSAEIGQGRRRDLFVVDAADPSSVVNLTEGRVYAPAFARWSPDGTRIAFSSAVVLEDGRPEPGIPSEDGEYSTPDDELFVIDVESKVLTRVTDNGWIDLAPVWAPDGNRLLFTSQEDGDDDLWIVALDSDSAPQNLFDDNDDPTDDALADWYWGTP